MFGSLFPNVSCTVLPSPCCCFRSPQSQLVQSHGEMPSGALGLSLWLASFLPFYTNQKHRLLATRCTRERLRACLKCADSMEKMARGVRRGEDIIAAREQEAREAAPAAASNIAGVEPGASESGAASEASVPVSVRAEGSRG